MSEDPERYISLHTSETEKSRHRYEYFYCHGDVKPWSVQYGGNGHYFRTLDGCIAYAVGRGWVKYHRMETERAVIERHFNQMFGEEYTGS